MQIGLTYMPLSTAVRLVARKFSLPEHPALNLLIIAMAEDRVAARGRFKGSRPIAIECETWKTILYEECWPVFSSDLTEVDSGSLLLWLDGFEKAQHGEAKKSSDEPAASGDEAERSLGSPPLSDAYLLKCIEAVYTAADEQDVKPPNILEIATCVTTLLDFTSKTASRNRIKKLAENPRFTARRLAVGRRTKKRPVHDLHLEKNMLPKPLH